MLPRVQSFTRGTAADLLEAKPVDPSARSRLAYLSQLLADDVGSFVLNAKSARLEVAVIDEHVLPLLINDGVSDECYFAAPESHYVKYLRHEVQHMKRHPTTVVLSRALVAAGAVARLTRMNRHVSVNNWLFSTNPRAALTSAQLGALLALLKDRWPNHAYVVRTIDPTDAEMVARLSALGFRLIINRPVHTWDPTRFPQLHPGKRGNVRRDIRALDKSGLEVGGRASLTAADAERLAALYRELYIVKHSRFNAFFSPAYFCLLIETGAVEIMTLRAAGAIVGFVVLFEEGDTIVPTIIGYDTADDARDSGLYRALMALLFRRSLDKGKQLFLSTGASSFKLNRGSAERLEYEAVFDRHLGAPRRLPWLMMRKVFDVTMKLIDTREI